MKTICHCYKSRIDTTIDTNLSDTSTKTIANMLLHSVSISFLINVLVLLRTAGAIDPDDMEIFEFVKSALVDIK